MEYLRCVVARVGDCAGDGVHPVILCRLMDLGGLVPVAGVTAQVRVGSVLTLSGQWTEDERYGRLFSVTSFEETLPETASDLEQYLGCGVIKGVGPGFAARIVQRFGTDTLKIIENEPERLLEVPGIGRVRVERIRKRLGR